MYSYVTTSIHADCGTDKSICEISVDTYLDKFCSQATSMKNRATIYTSVTVTVELPCPTTTVHRVQQTTITGIIQSL